MNFYILITNNIYGEIFLLHSFITRKFGFIETEKNRMRENVESDSPWNYKELIILNLGNETKKS